MKLNCTIKYQVKYVWKKTWSEISLFCKIIFNRENWEKETPSTFVCLNRIFDSFGHFGHVLPFCNGKNSKISFKNIKKYVSHWKH